MFWEVKYVDLPISIWKLVEAFYLKNYHKIWDILISFSHYFPSYFKVNEVYLSCIFSSLLWKCYLIIAFKNDRKYRKTRDKKNSIPKGNVLSILVLAQIFVCVCVCVCVCVWNHSVVSDSLQPHGLQPTRLLCPWDFPGKNTGVGCHFLLQGNFLTQGLNWVSRTAGRFFTIWATVCVCVFIIESVLYVHFWIL